MKEYFLKFRIQKPFGNLYRKCSLLIVVKNSRGKFLFGSKPDFYPKGITRLIGGGLEDNESIERAAQRELSEELGVKLNKSDFNHLALIKIEAIDKDEKRYETEISLFGVNTFIDKYNPGGDIGYIEELDEVQFNELINRYERLPFDNWYKGEEGEYSWGDYGQVYSKVHRIALELAKDTS